MNYIIKRSICVCICLILLILPSCFSAEKQYNSSISVLFDFSKTYFNKVNYMKSKTALNTINATIMEATDYMIMPIQINYIAISNVSLEGSPIATVIYNRKLFGSSDKIVTKPDELKRFLEITSDIILHKKSCDFTDISGAIHLATSITPEKCRGGKTIFILSDLQEELVPTASPPKLNLEGYNVILFYRILTSDGINPENLQNRLNVWTKKLNENGAQNVFCIYDGTTNISFINSFLRN